MSENEVVQVLLFGNKSFSKDMNFRIINPQFVSLKAVTELSCVYSFMYIYIFIFFKFNIVGRRVCYDELKKKRFCGIGV